MDAEGNSVLDRFGEELERLQPLPPVPFQVARVVSVSVRSTSVVGDGGLLYNPITQSFGVVNPNIICRSSHRAING